MLYFVDLASIVFVIEVDIFDQIFFVGSHIRSSEFPPRLCGCLRACMFPRLCLSRFSKICLNSFRKSEMMMNMCVTIWGRIIILYVGVPKSRKLFCALTYQESTLSSLTHTPTGSLGEFWTSGRFSHDVAAILHARHVWQKSTRNRNG